jgi:prefoldin subunit 5
MAEIEQWLKDGYTDYSIADNLGICHNTLIEYKRTQSEIIEAYTRARTHRNALVMHKMYKAATTETVALKKQKVGKDGSTVDIIEEIYVGPDVNAADLYLRNNSEDYKSAKADTSGLTLIQNNYQLPQIQQQIQQLEQELKKLETIETVALEVTVQD